MPEEPPLGPDRPTLQDLLSTGHKHDLLENPQSLDASSYQLGKYDSSSKFHRLPLSLFWRAERHYIEKNQLIRDISIVITVAKIKQNLPRDFRSPLQRR